MVTSYTTTHLDDATQIEIVDHGSYILLTFRDGNSPAQRPICSFYLDAEVALALEIALNRTNAARALLDLTSEAAAAPSL